ncbi:MAG: hypothetical protein KF774_07390 [Planctomyces sp.]|nr:hypothetical protein [Planctomyces sp.]
MPLELTIRDESTDGRVTGETVVEFLTESITVEELIKSRVYQEVQDYNQRRSGVFTGLVRPAEAEPEERGFKLQKSRLIDWNEQYEIARAAFEKGQVLILVDDRQVDRLDERIELRPAIGDRAATSVSFLRLTPLVGG